VEERSHKQTSRFHFLDGYLKTRYNFHPSKALGLGSDYPDIIKNCKNSAIKILPHMGKVRNK
jgi:hypothetical protein